MARLDLKSDGISPREIELQRGTTTLGRNPTNDFSIDDPSVSGEHCEISMTDDAVRVKDLGSTNGTFIDGQPVQEGDLHPSQTLRLGSVEMILRADADPVHNARFPKPALRVTISQAEAHLSDPPLAPPIPSRAPEPAVPADVAACVNHPQTRATLVCKKCHQLFCETCVVGRYLGGKSMKFCRACGDECVPIGQDRTVRIGMGISFYQRLPSAFVYPFKKDGLMLLISGTVVFAVLQILQMFLGGLVSLGIVVFAVGYLFAYIQRIIVSSAQGEEGLPDWPDFSNVWDDIISPFLQLTATWLACLAPAILVYQFAPEPLKIFGVPLIVLGLVYFPMALLAVAMYDTVAALNPLLVIPSMFRVPLAYFVTLLVLAGIIGFSFGMGHVLELLVPVPIVPTIIMEFFSLYFLTVEMRILGLLYNSEQHRLHWSF